MALGRVIILAFSGIVSRTLLVFRATPVFFGTFYGSKGKSGTFKVISQKSLFYDEQTDFPMSQPTSS